MSKPKRNTRGMQSRPPLSSSAARRVRQVIWIDMNPILEKERLRCKQVSGKLSASQKALNDFKSEVTPAFSAWFHSHFGEALTAVRGLHSKMTELSDLVSAVFQQSMYTGVSERTAYERLMKIRAAQELAAAQGHRPEEESFTHDEEHDPFERENFREKLDERDEFGDDQSLPPEFEDLLRMAFEELAGPSSRFDPEEYEMLLEEFRGQFREEFLGSEEGRSYQEESSEKNNRKKRNESAGHEDREADSDEARIKQLYRDLARKLHPDQNTSISSKDKELWYEVQAAYDSRNLAQLETLSALAEGGSIHWFLQVKSVSRLQGIYLDFQTKLAATKKALREVKKDPAWDFLTVQKTPSRMEQLKRRLDRDFRDDTESLKFEIERLEEIINRWKTPKRISKPRQSPKRKTSQLRSKRSQGKGWSKADMDAFTGFGSHFGRKG